MELPIVRWWGCASSVGLLPAALGPSFLDKGVGTGPAATQVGPAWRKLGQVCQKCAYGRQNCFRQVVADRHNNKISKISGHLVGDDQTTIEHSYSSNNNHFFMEGKEQSRSEQVIMCMGVEGHL